MGPARDVSSILHWRKLRWAVPAGAVIVTGAVLAGTMLASAAPPTLPNRTPAQIIASMRQAKAPSALTAVISETANLGLPALPALSGAPSSPLSAASFLSGTHTIDLWYAGPRQVRIAVPVSFGETDIRVNGNQAWLWDSKSQTATHVILPASSKAGRFLPGGRGPAGAFGGFTPQQAAKKLLALVGPTTKVSVAGTVSVAGRSAYQLVVAPRSSQSLIGKITIAVDGQTYLPLQVQVFARGSSSPAFSIGFTSLSFAKPAASNFTFTPPAGAHVKTIKPAARLRAPLSRPFIAPGKHDWIGVHPGRFRVVKLKHGHVRIYVGKGTAAPGVVHLRGKPGTQRTVFLHVRPFPAWLHGKAAQVKLHGRPARLPDVLCLRPVRTQVKAHARVQRVQRTVRLHGKRVQVLIVGKHRCVAIDRWFAKGGPAGLPVPRAPFALGPQTIGSGWLTVADIPAGGLLGLAGRGPLAPLAPGSSIHVKLVHPHGGPVKAGSAPMQVPAMLGLLMKATTKVHGSWGSGRLLRTPLLSVLITDKGQVLVGAVTPAVLFADAAKVK